MTAPNLATPLNNVSGLALLSAHAAGATTLVLQAGQGATITAALAELGLSISAGSPLRLTVVKAAAVNAYGQITDRSQLTIFEATGLTSDTLTGVTAVEGKTDLGFAAGDRVGVFPTAGNFKDIHDTLALKMNTGDAITSTQLPGSGVSAGTYTFSTVTVDTKGRVTSASSGTPPVSSVAGKTGAVTLAESDVSGLVADLAARPQSAAGANISGAWTFTAATVPFTGKVLVGASVAGSAAAQLEVTAKTSGTNILAGYTSTGASAFRVGSAGQIYTFAPTNQAYYGVLSADTSNTTLQGVNNGLQLSGSAVSVTAYGAYVASALTVTSQVPLDGTAGTEQWFTRISGAFAPTASAHSFVGILGDFTINQTGTSSGSYTGIRINITETAVLGTGNKLMDLQVGGASKFSVNSSGNTAVAGPIGVNGASPPAKAASPGTATGTDAAVINALATIVRNVGFCS